MEIVSCVLVRYPNGEVIYVSAAEYQTNPTAGSYVVREHIRSEPAESAPSKPSFKSLVSAEEARQAGRLEAKRNRIRSFEEARYRRWRSMYCNCWP